MTVGLRISEPLSNKAMKLAARLNHAPVAAYGRKRTVRIEPRTSALEKILLFLGTVLECAWDGPERAFSTLEAAFRDQAYSSVTIRIQSVLDAWID